MHKYRIAFVVGALAGLVGVVALLSGGDMWFVFLLICGSTILTTVRAPGDGPEELRENWHFSLTVLLAVVGIAGAAIFARGPLFGRIAGSSSAGAGAEAPIWLRVLLATGWFALTVDRARKRWRKPASV